jgi:hypothetical protein
MFYQPYPIQFFSWDNSSNFCYSLYADYCPSIKGGFGHEIYALVARVSMGCSYTMSRD